MAGCRVQGRAVEFVELQQSAQLAQSPQTGKFNAQINS
jgi:hypothetical protein